MRSPSGRPDPSPVTRSEMACDARVLYPSKQVTLVHSRAQLMPRFHPLLSDTIKGRLAELGIETVLGSRAVVPPHGFEGQTELATEDGRVVRADLIIPATGQTPNSGLLAALAPSAINQSGFIEVHPTLQVKAGGAEGAGLERVFAVGDIANSGAAKAARPGGAQAKVVLYVCAPVCRLLGALLNYSFSLTLQSKLARAPDQLRRAPRQAADRPGRDSHHARDQRVGRDPQPTPRRRGRVRRRAHPLLEGAYRHGRHGHRGRLGSQGDRARPGGLPLVKKEIGEGCRGAAWQLL